MNSFLLANTNGAGSLVLLGVMILALLVFYIMSSVNNKKRMEQYRQMQGDLKAGDVVQLTSGIIGRIVRVSEVVGIKTVVVETGEKNNKATLEVNIDAIAGVVPKEDNTIKVETTTESKESTTEQTEIDEEVSETLESKEKPAEQKSDKKKNKK